MIRASKYTNLVPVVKCDDVNSSMLVVVTSIELSLVFQSGLNLLQFEIVCLTVILLHSKVYDTILNVNIYLKHVMSFSFIIVANLLKY